MCFKFLCMVSLDEFLFIKKKPDRIRFCLLKMPYSIKKIASVNLKVDKLFKFDYIILRLLEKKDLRLYFIILLVHIEIQDRILMWHQKN